jgi:hypothetical protein
MAALELLGSSGFRVPHRAGAMGILPGVKVLSMDSNGICNLVVSVGGN